jgi:glycosyltransferase involved in cell wall biosynthesis
MTTTAPLVSILICSYNYARFVGQTIDSALRQTWPEVEVVVVDDGSTDESWSVISAFGNRITAIRQTNGGQGAAYNTCFERSGGQWLIYLDCDDLLDDDCIERCMAQVREDVHKVAFQMRVIDAEGHDSGNVIPYTMHVGDVRPILQVFGHYGGPPGSGNLYRRSAVGKHFPLDVVVWPMCADTVPYVAAACAGQVEAVTQPLGSYRVHKRANKSLGLFGNVLGSLRETLVLDDERRREALAMVAADLPFARPTRLLPTPTLVRTRIISWKIDWPHHPYVGDSRPSLLKLAAQSARAWPGYTLLDRLALLGWAAALLYLPRAFGPWLVGVNTSDVAKRQLRSFFGLRRPVP